jgi:hypothetical protein
MSWGGWIVKCIFFSPLFSFSLSFFAAIPHSKAKENNNHNVLLQLSGYLGQLPADRELEPRAEHGVDRCSNQPDASNKCAVHRSPRNHHVDRKDNASAGTSPWARGFVPTAAAMDATDAAPPFSSRPPSNEAVVPGAFLCEIISSLDDLTIAFTAVDDTNTPPPPLLPRHIIFRSLKRCLHSRVCFSRSRKGKSKAWE